MRDPYVSPRWPGRLERKIDVYHKVKGYVCSSNAYRRCRDAVAGVALAKNLPANELFARFDKKD